MVHTSEVWGGHHTANGLHSTRAERKPTTNSKLSLVAIDALAAFVTFLRLD